MKKIMSLLLAVMLLVPAVGHAFLYDVEILESKVISALSDEALVSKYIDVLVEMEATKTFHQNSGFSPDGYAKFKDLIRYRIQLSVEVQKRNLEVRKFLEIESKK